MASSRHVGLAPVALSTYSHFSISASRNTWNSPSNPATPREPSGGMHFFNTSACTAAFAAACSLPSTSPGRLADPAIQNTQLICKTDARGCCAAHRVADQYLDQLGGKRFNGGGLYAIRIQDREVRKKFFSNSVLTIDINDEPPANLACEDFRCARDHFGQRNFAGQRVEFFSVEFACEMFPGFAAVCV